MKKLNLWLALALFFLFGYAISANAIAIPTPTSLPKPTNYPTIRPTPTVVSEDPTPTSTSTSTSTPTPTNTPIPTISVTPSLLEAAAWRAMAEHGNAFGVSNSELELKVGAVHSASEDPFYGTARHGRSKAKVEFRQKLPDPVTGQELEVADAELAVWLTLSNQPAYMKGTFLKDLTIPAVPMKVSQQRAVQIATRLFKDLFPGAALKILSISKKIFAPRIFMTWAANPDPTGYQAWVVHVVRGDDGSPPANEIFYISAKDGTLLWHTTNVRGAGLGRKVWDCTRYQTFGGCVLDIYHPGYHYTFGRSEGKPARGTNPIYGGEDTDRTYDWFEAAQTYLSSTFNRTGCNGQGGTGNGINVLLNVNQAKVYVDPSPWGATCPNAYFNGYEIGLCSQMDLEDVFGHECAHAFAGFAHWEGSIPVGMVYEGESGALDESQADLFGKMFEKYLLGNIEPIWPSRKWNMPEAFSSFLLYPFRRLDMPSSLTNPKLNDRHFPDTFNDRGTGPDDGFYCGSEDNGGVHHNSTVISKAIYILTHHEPGNPTPPNVFNFCEIQPIDDSEVEQIWYRAVTQYFSRTETFNQAYLSLRFACEDLFPPIQGMGMDWRCQSLVKSLQAVGLNTPGACKNPTGPISAPQCQIEEANCNFGPCVATD